MNLSSAILVVRKGNYQQEKYFLGLFAKNGHADKSLNFWKNPNRNRNILSFS